MAGLPERFRIPCKGRKRRTESGFVKAVTKRLRGRKMKPSVTMERKDCASKLDARTSLVAVQDIPQKSDPPCHNSVNFVAQLAGTFLQTPQSRARRRVGLHDAMQIYDYAVAPSPAPLGTRVCFN